MARAKKEEVVETDSRIPGWANGLRIVCNILKVLDIIGIVCMVLVLAFIPSIAKNVKIDENTIRWKDTKIEYKLENVDFLTISIDGGNEQKINTKTIYKYLAVEDLSKININELRNVIMVDLVFFIIIAILDFMIFNLLSKLLKQIRDENKAFVLDGSKVLVTVVWLLLAIEIIKIVTSICTGIFVSGINNSIDTNININFSNILMMLVIYFISLLYKRGEELEK